jgi:hypothetical protein
MQFTSTFALLASTLSVIPAMAMALSVRQPSGSVFNYDTRYDDPNGLLSTTACSANAGVLEGHNTFGSIPTFPHIAGSIVVEGFNSTNCGGCYRLFYDRKDGSEPAGIPFTVINSDPKGFTSSVQSLKDLTGFDVENFPGDVPIVYEELPSYFCGF